MEAQRATNGGRSLNGPGIARLISHSLSSYAINTPYHPTLSTHPIIPCYQHTLSHTLSIYPIIPQPINPPFLLTHSITYVLTHSLNPFLFCRSLCVIHSLPPSPPRRRFVIRRRSYSFLRSHDSLYRNLRKCIVSSIPRRRKLDCISWFYPSGCHQQWFKSCL